MSQQLSEWLDEADVKHLLKYIQHKHQLLTFGFCRMNATIIDKIIPAPIINICLIYTFLIIEYFKYNVGNLHISDDKRTATNSTVSNTAAFGAFIINCDENNTDIYTWKIKINSVGYIVIGVDEVNNDHELVPWYFLDKEYHHYAYSNLLQIFRDKYSSNRETIIDLDRKFRYAVDDIITMIIDGGKKTVDFYKNDKHVYQCKNVHPNQYRLGIHLCADLSDLDSEDMDYPASVTLRNFSIQACD